MASNDQWPPVASTGKGSFKVNGNRRNIKDSQQRLLSHVTEIFGSVLEPEIILTVVKNCNWELPSTIDALMMLTETVDSQQTRDNMEKSEDAGSPAGSTSQQTLGIKNGSKEVPRAESAAREFPTWSQGPEPAALPKWQKVKTSGTKNRMNSFCGNIIKLKSSGEGSTNARADKFSARSSSGKPASPNPRELSRKKEKFVTTKMPGEEQKIKKSCAEIQERKAERLETNLKYHCAPRFRCTGMESSSDDDDVDVVIEDESSDYKINPSPSMLTNVSQFLSPPTQTPPKRANPEFHMISTPSPPRTPQRSARDTLLNKIKSTVIKGYKIMILVRRPSESGVSTMAQTWTKYSSAVAKDIVATTVGGNPMAYIFCAKSKDRRDHTFNHERLKKAVKDGRSPVIVDNLNIAVWKMRLYVTTAVEYGYIVEILESDIPSATDVHKIANKSECVLSGSVLLERFSLKYSPQNVPPQLRRIPAIIPSGAAIAANTAGIKSNWRDRGKNTCALSSQDIESMRSSDETSVSTDSEKSSSDSEEEGNLRGESYDCLQKLQDSDKESFKMRNSDETSVSTDSEKSSSDSDEEGNLKDESYDYLQKLQDSDDGSFKMLEGSGSENSNRSLAKSKLSPEDSVEDATTKSSSSTAALPFFGAIGSERKRSLFEKKEGTESGSDNDADVVIEDESSDYKINLSPSMLINVSQFLSPPSQTPPKRANPEFHMISTPSPTRAPQRSSRELLLNKIKSTVIKGDKIVIILRGLPGSGKSTLARDIVATTVGGNPAEYIFNTDDFFVTLGRGVYKYEPSKLQEAHSWNQRRVWKAVKEGRSPVIVDNTNIEAWEMRPYAAMAVENGYIVEILQPDTPWATNVNELAKRNSHNVPRSKIRERSERFERVASGGALLAKFSLKYSAQNTPPQLRRVPAIGPSGAAVASSTTDIKSYWSNHDKNTYVLTSQDIESMRNIDETRVRTDFKKSSNETDKEVNLRGESYDYVQDNLNEVSRIKVTKHEMSSVDSMNASLEGEQSETENLSSSSSQQSLGAIGSERKGSLSAESNGGNFSSDKSNAKKCSDIQLNQRAIMLAKANFSPEEAVEDSETKAKSSSPTAGLPVLGAIGSERKRSLSEKKDASPDNLSEVLRSKVEKHEKSSLDSMIASLEAEQSDTENLSSSGSQHSLGAIGSERKGSLSAESIGEHLAGDKSDAKDCNDIQLLLSAIGSDSACAASNSTSLEPEEIIDDDVLTQCWDFTLLLGHNKLHSRHSALDLPPMKKSPSKQPENLVKVSTDQGQDVDQSADKNYDKIWNLEGALNRVFDTPKPQDLTAHNLTDESISLDAEKEKFIVEEIFDLENDSRNYDSTLVDDSLDTNEPETEIADPQVNQLDDAPIADIFSDHPLVEKIEQATEVTEDAPQQDPPEITSEPHEPPEPTPKVTKTLVSFFDMLKTAILGPDDEPPALDLKDDSGSSIYETALPSQSSSVERDVDQSENPSSDTIDAPCALEISSEPNSCAEIAGIVESTAKILEEDDEIYSNLSTNPLGEETKRSRAEKSSPNDNINSISWKESPFPIDSEKLPVLVLADDNKPVQKAEASTNTTYYDFNVAYVGGTSEPGYRVLSTASRCINEGPRNARPERPPVKLMLDKSSMTSQVDILASEPSLSPEENEEPPNRIQELVELFPNIPIESLTAFYRQECNGNFDWTVEVLLEDVPNDFTIKSLANKRSDLKSNNQEKKSDRVVANVKQRSHSSSPRHRRQRTKDFRSFSTEHVENAVWLGQDTPVAEKNSETVKKDDETILNMFYENAASATSLPIAAAESPEESSSSAASGVTEPDNDLDDDLIELNLGRDFVNQLEHTFGNAEFTFPEEFKPVVRMRKSMAEKLHALWIESMYDQLNDRHAKLDEMIAKDEEIARALDREETVQLTREPVVPNLEEIMDMEMALACYKNELKQKLARETPNDMASRLSRQMLCESLPDIDPQTLSEILRAHHGNFKETCEIIESSTGRTISKTETLKKQQSLLDRVREESKNRGISENLEDIDDPSAAVSSDAGPEKLSYTAALTRGQDAREEAQKQFLLRVENLNKAAEAYRKGQPGVAAYYSQMARLHNENIEAAHAEAAEALISAQVDHADDKNTLDLHNFFVPEALLALDRFLELQMKKLGKSNKRSFTLYIITGRGARSNNGLSKIKPAVSKKLISRNIRFTETNPGCLKVTLSKKNGVVE